jgi:hypothetical protein
MTVPNANNVYLPPVIQIPSALTILSISQANPAVVTVQANSDQMNTYIQGQKIKFTVPFTYGMWQIDGKTPIILAINGQQLTIAINTINFDAFTTPPAGSFGPATIAPFGSQNLQFSNSTNQVPFQSFNNVGN